MDKAPLFLTAAFAIAVSVFGSFGCSSSDDSKTDDDAFAYGPRDPVARELPAELRGATWLAHLEDDLLPYWTHPDALGEPEGNFPTQRYMDGTSAPNHARRPRMLGRQTYVYAMAYALSGEPRLLELADAGFRYLLDAVRAPDGSWPEQISSGGTPISRGVKSAQDTAYATMGLAAYYFVTRSAEAETAILATRDLLFDPDRYFDSERRRIHDAMSNDLSEPRDMFNDQGSELVAQLDPINAFMLLVQPTLSDADRRQQFLDDMTTLATAMREQFWQDGIYWGVDNQKGSYGARHVDFGHTLKAYWMTLQIDKRLAATPFRRLLDDHIHTWVDRAYDDAGRWKRRMLGPDRDEAGSDWWIYAEADQLAATLSLIDDRYLSRLEQTTGHWMSDYVDPEYSEVIPSINPDGSPSSDWPVTDTAKCNVWKNGYHSTEHAMVLYLVGQALAGEEARLYFAVEADAAEDFVARPYFFEGREVARIPGDTRRVGTRELTQVEVRFRDIF